MRLRRKTLDRLRALAERWAELGVLVYAGTHDRAAAGLDTVIAELLRRDNAHRQRAARQRRRGRRSRDGDPCPVCGLRAS